MLDRKLGQLFTNEFEQSDKVKNEYILILCFAKY